MILFGFQMNLYPANKNVSCDVFFSFFFLRRKVDGKPGNESDFIRAYKFWRSSSTQVITIHAKEMYVLMRALMFWRIPAPLPQHPHFSLLCLCVCVFSAPELCLKMVAKNIHFFEILVCQCLFQNKWNACFLNHFAIFLWLCSFFYLSNVTFTINFFLFMRFCARRKHGNETIFWLNVFYWVWF